MDRYVQFGGRDTCFLRIAEQCRDRGFHVRIFTCSWLGARPSGVEIVIVPVASFAEDKRFERFAGWVRRTLAVSPVHCAVGFDKMPGLDIYFANAEPVSRVATRRVRGYRRSANFNLARDAERALLAGELDIVYPSAASARRFCLATAGAHETERPLRQHVLPPCGARPVGGGNLHPGAVERRAASGGFELLMIVSDLVSDGVDRALFMLARLSRRARFARGDARFRLAVVSSGVATQGFTRMAEGLGLGDEVRFHRTDDLEPHWATADLMLHVPYFADTNPNVIAALTGGLPVVTLAGTSYADEVSSARAGVVLDEPFDPEQFLDAVDGALDAAVLAEWRNRAQDYARRRPRLDMSERMADIIEDRINERGEAVSR